MSKVEKLVNAILKGAGSPKFASFIYRAVKTGEISRVTVLLGADTLNLYAKDAAMLADLLKNGNLTGVNLVALQELIASRNESGIGGIGNNSQYTCKDVYVHVLDGLKIHAETGEWHVTGLVQHKEVIVPGEYKPVKSSEKTIAKNMIRAALPSGKFRQYKLSKVQDARINGEVLEFEMETI